MRNTRLVPVLALVAFAACADQPTAPEGGDGQGKIAAARQPAVKFWHGLASVTWNELATQLTFQHAVDASRLYAYLSLAQYSAARAAELSGNPHPPVSAAIGAASAVVLSSFFQSQTTVIEAALDAQEAAPPWPGSKHEDFAAGEAIGRTVGAAVMAWAASDGVGLTDPGTPPVGPGYWPWTPGSPMVRGHLGARAFFLESRDEFRSPPPPAFNTQAFVGGLAEVRQISDTRTAEQTAIANYWNLNQSGRANAVWNRMAQELIVRYRRSDAEATRILFLANAAAFDALIGCFDAKYHYWLIRPSQADPGIVTVFPPPPFPAYPSAHSCASGAMSGVLARAFPSERAQLEELAQQSSLSRLYAGIHYRFDMVAGLELGGAVAGKAWDADLVTQVIGEVAEAAARSAGRGAARRTSE